MNDRRELAAFEQEVRAAFRSHLAALERSVPARPPEVAWSERDTLRGRVVEREARWITPRRRHRSTVSQLAAALGAVAAVAAFALVANLALRAVQPGPAASGGPSAAASSSSFVLEGHEIASFGTDELTALAPGYASYAYVIDGTADLVERVSLFDGSRSTEIVRGQPAFDGGVVGRPRLLAPGGCLLVMDDLNQIWEWCTPSGLGSLSQAYFAQSRVEVEITAFTTWPAQSLGEGYHQMSYILAVEPGRGQLVRYPLFERPDAVATDYLAEPRDLSGVETICSVDDAVFLLDRGRVVRFVDGRETDWQPAAPPAGAAPQYDLMSVGLDGERRLYLYDSANSRVVAVSATDGSLLGTYGAQGEGWTGGPAGMFVAVGRNPAVMGRTVVFSLQTGLDPAFLDVPVLYWIADGRLWGAALADDTQGATPTTSLPVPPPTPTPSDTPPPSGSLATPTTSLPVPPPTPTPSDTPPPSG
jgi:hypothetical protein